MATGSVWFLAGRFRFQRLMNRTIHQDLLALCAIVGSFKALLALPAAALYRRGAGGERM